MNWGVAEWTVLGIVITSLGTLGKVLVGLVNRLGAVEAVAESAQHGVHAGTIAHAASSLNIDRLEADLVHHRVTVAREYVSKETLESLESRIVDAINKLGDRLDKILQSR